MNIEFYKKELMKSPMFHLSLSSKELFHSNFIAYLIENDSKVVNYILGDKFKLDNDCHLNVYREKSNFDILLLNNISCIVIENKIKSIPRVEQLIAYREKMNKNYKQTNKVLILLTLHYTGNIDFEGTDCIIVYYKDLIVGLKEYLCIVNDTYLHGLITDYVHFMGVIVKLYDELYYDMKQSLFIDSEIYAGLKTLRIYDLFVKSRYDILKSHLKISIERILNSNQIVIETRDWEKLQLHNVLVDSNFTRNDGLVEFKIPLIIKGDIVVVIGAQLQGNKFKLFVQATKKEIVKPIIQHLNEEGLWFDFTILKRRCKTNERQTIDYCKYDSKIGLLKYKYLEVDDINGNDVISIFVEYLSLVICNRVKFVEAVSPFV